MVPTQTSIAAAGDLIITRSLSSCTDPRLASILEPIREADVAFGNLEVLLHDYEGYPAANSGGTYMRAPPSAADELIWAGFDCFGAATNHTGDFSHGGMEATMNALEERNIPYAGLGRTLSQARKPAYVDTAGGRVALIAACSTIPPGSEAGRQRPDMQGRPGLSPLRLETTYEVPEDRYEDVVELSERLGLEAIKAHREKIGFPIDNDRDEFMLPNIGGQQHLHFEVGDEFSIKQRIRKSDAEQVLQQIGHGSRQANWVIASHHIHEGARGYSNDNSVPPCLERFARKCIDTGADMFIGHGPHVMRGIEIYDGAPIFYSLGDFMMQNETIPRLPAEIYERRGLDPYTAEPAELFDARVFDDDDRVGFLADRRFWETVVPVCDFKGNTLERIELYPAILGFEDPRPQRGIPRLADGEEADAILGQITSLSDPYNVEIQHRGGRGIIEL